jgi:twitching motility protein PilT
MGQTLGEDDLDLEAALRTMIEMGASDLHVTTGAPPTVRLDGRLKHLEGFQVMTADRIQRTIYSILTQRQREVFEENLELDFAYAVRGVARFRVNLYQQRDSLGAVFRVIPYEIKPLDELGVPPVVANFAGLPRGLVLITGPTGSGKSTTLAAIIDLANRTRTDHIMTVEDPIEFLHRHKKSLINQREVGADTLSFANALKHVLRQDPDIILVGELRDLETIGVALTAAETGHLVFGTLHTQDAAQTVDRVIDVFPSHQQDQIRTQLAAALQGVVCQTLLPRSNGRGRVVATEVLLATPAIRNLIREGKTHQHLSELVRLSKVTYEAALEKCQNIEDFNQLVGRTSRMAQGAATLGDEISLAIADQGLPPVMHPTALNPGGNRPNPYGRP